MLDTVGERGVGVRSDMSQFSRLPDAPIKEEGTVPKLFRKYENLYGDLSDGTWYKVLIRDEEYGPKFFEEFQDRTIAL